MAHFKSIFIVLVIVTNTMLGQQIKQSKFGLTVGLAYNTQVKTKESFAPVSFAHHNRASPYIGIIYRDSINKWFSIKTSLYYIQRGVRFNYIYDTPFYTLHADQKFTCHYLSFPIKLNFNIKKFFIGVGLEGSILLKGHYDIKIESGFPTTGTVNTQIVDKWYGESQFQTVDAGYNFNMGYKFKNFEIEFSTYHGLIAPPKFDIFGSQHFEFKYLYQQTFMLGINYFPKFKRYLPKK